MKKKKNEEEEEVEEDDEKTNLRKEIKNIKMKMRQT